MHVAPEAAFTRAYNTCIDDDDEAFDVFRVLIILAEYYNNIVIHRYRLCESATATAVRLQNQYFLGPLL